MSGKQTILLVDDHEENLRVLAGILAPEGYDLVPANSGEQVFERLVGCTPDLILLDVVMPGIDGVEVCRRLKRKDGLRDVPVIFLSAADDKALVVEALESGGVDYIAKPFNQAELLTRVRTHMALKKARDSLALLAADKDELLRVMAHDFKNQISGVMMSSRLLLDREEVEALPERSLKLIRNIGESSDRMMGFLKSFLSNQATSKQVIKVHPVDIEEIITSVLADVEASATVKGTVLERGAVVEGWQILGDGNASRQVLDNLVENAVKFCPKGSRVVVSSEVVGGQKIAVIIQDNGPGFTEGDRERMFQRYSRLSARPSGGEPSTGLGLFIARNLMREMGGDLRLEESEEGARFVMTFRARSMGKAENK